MGSVTKENPMNKLIVSILLSLTVTTTACSKKSNSCDAVVDHTLTLLPNEMKSMVAGDKASAIAKCEKMSPEARQCAADASSLEDLMKCPKQ
jgi:hypothetical protein